MKERDQGDHQDLHCKKAAAPDAVIFQTYRQMRPYKWQYAAPAPESPSSVIAEPGIWRRECMW
jgi:hypothetical protein